MKPLVSRAVAFALGLGLFATTALAQVSPGPVTPSNVPLATAVITLTAQGAATVNSSDQSNLYDAGVRCTFNQTAHTGTPSSTLAIQFKDVATGTYQSLATSGAITADSTPTTVVVYPGMQTASLPTGMVAHGGAVGRVWRAQVVVAGTTPGVTAKVGCELLK